MSNATRIVQRSLMNHSKRRHSYNAVRRAWLAVNSARAKRVVQTEPIHAARTDARRKAS